MIQELRDKVIKTLSESGPLTFDALKYESGMSTTDLEKALDSLFRSKSLILGNLGAYCLIEENTNVA